jgi:hypothetical protein
LILLFAFIQTTYAQDDLNSSEDDYLKQSKTEAGFVFTMAETGSGFGAFMALPFGSIFHVGAIVDAYFLRDSKQFEYMDPYTGGIYSINNRPFISGGFGPVFGMNFPEDESKKNQKEWSFGGFVGAGADVSVDRKFFISVRAQYKILPFSKPLGERSNHSMFELRFEIGKRF